MNTKEKAELREFAETLKYNLKYFVTESQEETLIITRPEADYLLSLIPSVEHPQPLDAEKLFNKYAKEGWSGDAEAIGYEDFVLLINELTNQPSAGHSDGLDVGVFWKEGEYDRKTSYDQVGYIYRNDAIEFAQAFAQASITAKQKAEEEEWLKYLNLVVWLNNECLPGTMTGDLSHDFADILRKKLDEIISLNIEANDP